MNKTLKIELIVDIINGSGMYILYINDIPIQYIECNLVSEIAITGTNKTAICNNIINGISSLAIGGSTIASGNILSGALSSESGMMSIATANGSGGVESKGTNNANISNFTSRQPYVVYSLCVYEEPSNYSLTHGYPLNKNYTLEQVQGFSIIDNPRLDNVICTENEKQEIKEILQSGVFY